MKKTFLATLIMTSLVLTPAVFAQDYGAKALINQVQRAENQASKTAQRQNTQLDNLKKRADTAIDNRIATLNKLLTRIQNDNKLSSEIKTSLSADIQTSISSLTALKAKIDADTDLATTRTDAQSIVTGYRIYAVFIPKERLLVTIGNLLGQTSTLQSLTPKIQDLINNLKSQGKDTSKLQPLLDDVNSKLSTISSQLVADKTKVAAVSISDVDGSHTIFVAVRQDLAGVRSEFAQIRSDFAQMRDAFQIDLRGTGNSSSPSATTKN